MPRGCWERNSSPMEQQPEILTTEASLWSPSFCFGVCFGDPDSGYQPCCACMFPDEPISQPRELFLSFEPLSEPRTSGSKEHPICSALFFSTSKLFSSLVSFPTSPAFLSQKLLGALLPRQPLNDRLKLDFPKAHFGESVS